MFVETVGLVLGFAIGFIALNHAVDCIIYMSTYENLNMYEE